jgi:hypothetical protein
MTIRILIILLLLSSCAHRPCTMDEWLVRQDCQ